MSRSSRNAESWPEPELEPSCLIVPWPDDTVPTLTGVLAAFSSAWTGELRVLGDGPGEDGEVLFEAELADPSGGDSVLVQAAPTPYWGPLSPAAETTASAYSVGIRVLLSSAEHPILPYTGWIRTLARAFPDAPFVADATTCHVHGRSRVEELRLNEHILLPDHVLWTLQEVHDDRRPALGVWLHTHGLWRCGALELEMLDVPREHSAAAGSLVNAVASLLLDEDPPAPGEPFVVADGTVVVLQPWQRVVAGLPRDILGGPRDREEGGSHVGGRAVVCSPRSTGSLRKRWMWPREAIELVGASHEIVIRKTTEATLRAARQARATWAEFAMAFFALKGEDRAREQQAESADSLFLVKLGFEIEDGACDVSHEHMWFRVLRIRGGRAEGELLNEPVYVTGLAKGQVIAFGTDQLSDWLVHMPGVQFGSHQIEALRAYCSSARETHDGRPVEEDRRP